MAGVAAVPSHLLVVYLVFVLPPFGRARYRWLKQQIEAGGPAARLRFYRLVMLAQLGLVAAVLAIWVLGRLPRQALGLVAPPDFAVTTSTVAVFLAALAVSSIVLRYKGERALKRLIQMAGPLLPVSAAERWTFVLVGAGAGVSEELAFRGFLFYYCLTFLPTLGQSGAVLATSIAFGLGHLYQGVRGVTLTAVVGLFLAMLYVISGSLIVPIVVHAALDLRLLVVVTPERLRKLSA